MVTVKHVNTETCKPCVNIFYIIFTDRPVFENHKKQPFKFYSCKDTKNKTKPQKYIFILHKNKLTTEKTTIKYVKYSDTPIRLL